jgi:hypothetical protein
LLAVGCDKTAATPTQVPPIAIPPTDHIAPGGALVNGFPAQLLIDPSAVLVSSAYLSVENDYIAVLTTPKSPDDIFNIYLNYLESNGYTVTKQIKYLGYAFILTNKAGKTVSVEIRNIPNANTTFKISVFAGK